MSESFGLPSWTIPATQALKNRALIRRAFDEAISLASGRKSNVVFTRGGARGDG